MKVFVVTGMTESGDEFVYVFQREPTHHELEAFFAREQSEEWEAGCIPGWNISEEEVREFSDPIFTFEIAYILEFMGLPDVVEVFEGTEENLRRHVETKYAGKPMAWRKLP